MWTLYPLERVVSESSIPFRKSNVIVCTWLSYFSMDLSDNYIVITEDGLNRSFINHMQISGATTLPYIKNLILIYPIALDHPLISMAENVIYFVPNQFKINKKEISSSIKLITGESLTDDTINS